jgi:hypothetical protein
MGLKAVGVPDDQFTMRGMTDVSMVANAGEPGFWIVTTNAILKQSGKGCGSPYCFTGEGGTSAGSPIRAGISRLLAAALNTRRLGNINPRLYEISADGSAALVDVSTEGKIARTRTAKNFLATRLAPATI